MNRRQVFKREILETIYRLERAEGLPYTTGNGGVYAKLGDDVQQKVLLFSSYATSSSDVISAGMDSQYHWSNLGGYFTHNGFTYNVKSAGGSYESLRNNISNSWRKGVLSGNHYLPGFAFFGSHGSDNIDLSANPIERDITSKPDQIAETTRTTLVGDITQSATAIVIKGRDDRFRQYHFKNASPKRGLARIGSEIIAYTGAEDHGASDTRLTGAIRGILRTRATRHTTGSKVHALRFWNHYNAFSWGDRSVQAQGIALGNSINDTGMQFASLDGIESYWDDSIGELAANVLYKNLHNTMTSKEFMGEGSRLWHYNWHFHNRFMWGEARTQVLQGTVHYQLANMVMMGRNFLPAHTGGFYAQFNNADDLEWVGAKVAAHNAGMLIRSSGLDNARKAVLKFWNQAQEAGAFSDYQRVRMGPWERTFALEEVNNGSADWNTGQRWRLKERAMTLTYDKVNEADDDKTTITVTAVSYGSESNPFYVARPWAGFSTRNIAGDALVSTSSKRDAGYQGDNAVDGFIGMFNPSSRYDFCHGSNHYEDSARCRSGWVPGSTSEWHTASGDSERWIKLTWDRPQKIRTVFLSDRSHPDNNVTGYTIEFEDGTMLSGANLPVRGVYSERRVSTGSVESSWVKVSITSHDGSNPGLGEVAVIAEDPNFKGHLAKNASILARPTTNPHPSHAATGNDQRLFDGVTDSTSPNHIDVGEGSKFIVIDLGGPAMVDGLNVWRYYNDVRQYHDVVYQLSTTSDFSADVTTVFNNDANNSTQQGAGSDPEYREGPSGKPVYFPPVRARYLRLWSSGNTLNNDNHYTEVEVYGLRNLAFGKPVSQSGDAGYDNGSSRATDGDIRNGGWDIGPKATSRYRQVDIGGPWNIDSLRVWHELSDSRRIRYKDVVIRISTTADFSSDVTTVFNNDMDNSLGLGAGTDGEYDETESGKIVHFPTTRARYIRLHTYGNIYDDQNRLLEVMVGQRAPQDLSEAPVAMAGALVTLVNTAGNLDLSTLASDADGGTLSYATTNPTNGSVSLTGAVVTYTPNTGYFGSDSFTYTVTDGDNAPATATVSVTVHRAPTSRDAWVTTPANTALTYDLSSLAFDPDGDTLTWMVGAASHGMARLQFVTGGSVIYTPNAGYVGIDSFTYTVTDSHDATATGTITVTVVPAGALVLKVNAIATDGTVNIEERAAGFAISGDTGSEGGVTVTVRVGVQELTAVSSAADPAIWSVDVPGNAAYIVGSSVAVRVSAAKTGYTAPDAQAFALAVDLTVPTAPTYTAPVSLQVGVALAPLNPSGGLGIDGYSAAGLPSGLSIDPLSGAIDGTPDTANASTASVTVTASDTAGNADTVTIEFPAVAAGDRTLTGFRYSAASVTFGSAAPTVTAPGGAQTAVSYTAAPSTVCTVDASTGALTLVGVGECVVTATAAGTANYNQATAMYTVTVQTAEDNAPVTADDTATVAAGGSVRIDVTGNDTDANDTIPDDVTVSVVSAPSNGSATVNADKSITYAHNGGTATADSFTYKLNDGASDSNIATVSINVIAVNKAPMAMNHSATTLIDTPLTVDLLPLASDPDGDELFYEVQSAVHGTVSLTVATVTYTPAADFAGVDRFDYVVSDGRGGVAVGTVEVSVAVIEMARQRVVPVTIRQVAGPMAGEVSAERLIDRRGLSAPAKSALVDRVKLASKPAAPTGGVTGVAGGAPYYFSGSQETPVFEMDLGGLFNLRALQVGGSGEGVDPGSEASSFRLEFSADGGVTFGEQVETVETSGLLGSRHEELPFTGAVQANWVRMTIADNAYGRGLVSVGGGDRVHLGEVAFWAGPPSVQATQVVVPARITQKAGEGEGEAVARRLIDGSGLSALPLPHSIYDVRHTEDASSARSWRTAASSETGAYFDGDLEAPQFDLFLGRTQSLMALAVWGLAGSLDEATDFSVAFSTDGGVNFDLATEAVRTGALLGEQSEVLLFDRVHDANAVRLTITENAHGRAFPGSEGGDRVGLGEVRFLSGPHPVGTSHVLAPAGIAQTAGDAEGASDAGRLIDGSGLSAVPRVDNLIAVEHGGENTFWRSTAASGSDVYFDGTRPSPVFEVDLRDSHCLRGLVVWGTGVVSGDQGAEFEVAFSTDGGATYGAVERLLTTAALGAGNERLLFSEPHAANALRITVINNAYGRGLETLTGGERVALGELRCVAAL